MKSKYSASDRSNGIRLEHVCIQWNDDAGTDPHQRQHQRSPGENSELRHTTKEQGLSQIHHAVQDNSSTATVAFLL
jgi:hypothetical protein